MYRITQSKIIISIIWSIIFLTIISAIYSFIYTDIILRIIPLLIVGSILIARIILIIFKRRPLFDIWAVFTYTAVFVFIVSPLYHLISNDPMSQSLPMNFSDLYLFVSWTSIPIIPLFFLGGFLKRSSKRNSSKKIKSTKKLNNGDFNISSLYLVGNIYVLIGGFAHVVLRLIGNIPGFTGTLLLLADFFSVGLLLLYYIWGTNIKVIKNKEKLLGIVFLVIIMLLIFFLNIDRGSRFFILVYGVWGFYLYNLLFHNVKFKTIILVVLILIPMLNSYKLYKYSDFDSRYFTDSTFRTEVKEDFSYRTPLSTVAGDLGRYYIWMTYYYSLNYTKNIDFQYGATYKDAVLTMLPSWAISNKPPGIVEISSDAEFGRGYYEKRKPNAAKIAGFWGESYVNFGLLGVWLLSIIGGYILQCIDNIIKQKKLGIVSVFGGGAFVLFGAEILLHDTRLVLWHVMRHFVTLLPLYLFIKLSIEKKKMKLL